jgi:AraC-like DNA-binding protein
MLTTRTFSIRNLLRQAELRGAQIEPILKDFGLTSHQIFVDPEFQITFEIFHRFWTDIPRILNEPSIGLYAAENDNRDYPPISEHLVRVSKDVREAFHAAKYSALTIPWANYDYTETPDGGGLLDLSSKSPANQLPNAYIDYGLAVTYLNRLKFSSKSWSPAKLEVVDRTKRSREPYEKLFGCPVQFGAERNRFWVSSESLEIPILQPDPSLFSLLSGFAARELDKLRKLAPPPEKSFKAQVMELMSAALVHREVQKELIARRLGMSEKTLQRRLKDEGTSYHDLLDELRQEMAKSLLQRRTEITIEGISYLLGYSEPSAFYKAYRRWTGKSLTSVS